MALGWTNTFVPHASTNVFISVDWQDGVVAVYADDRKFILTTPNMDFIPEPFVGLVQVHLRSNYAYGPVDPFLWPQIFSPGFEYLAVLRHPYPETHRYAPIWWSPKTSVDFHIVHGSAFTHLGSMRSPSFDLLDALVSEMSSHVADHQADVGLQPHLNYLHTAMIRARDRVKFYPCTFRDMCFQVREVQRFWLQCRAYIDYTRLVATESRHEPLPVQKGYIGAFTTDPGVVQQLFHAGIPVWWIRPNVGVTKPIEPQRLNRMRRPYHIVQTMWVSGSQPLYSGLAGSEHLRVITQSKHSYVDVSHSPLLYRYDRDSYISQRRETSSTPNNHPRSSSKSTRTRLQRDSTAPCQLPPILS